MKISSTTLSLPSSLLCLSLHILSHSPLINAQTTSQSSISISSFDSTPNTGLSAPCSAAYTGPITGCQMSDFVPTNPCSSSCLSSLQAAQADVEASCANDNSDIPSSSLLSYFKAGNGIEQLCVVMKNAATTMSTVVSSSAPTGTGSSATSVLLSGTLTVTPGALSGTTGPLLTASPSSTGSVAAAQKSTGVMGLPRIALYSIVIGAVVVCGFVVLVTYFCFNVRFKRSYGREQSGGVRNRDSS